MSNSKSLPQEPTDPLYPQSAPATPPTEPSPTIAPVAAEQPVAVPPVSPVQEPTAITSQEATDSQFTPEAIAPVRELKIYSHSSLVYWWPVWAVGYLMAALTFWQGNQYQVEDGLARFHPSSNLGVFFFLVLFIVIMITSLSVRGLVSGLVILGMGLTAVIFAYFGWWDAIFSWLGDLKIYLNFGAYFWFATLMLITWMISVFGVDRMSYWHVKSGQITKVFVFGAGSKTYDTVGMTLEKHREDLFRHWLLGLGSGDLSIRTIGSSSQSVEIQNVMFIGSKVETIQRLIAEETQAA